MDPIWAMWKDAVLEVVWLLTELFVPLEAAKTVPPSDMVLVCWGYFEVEDFHSESVVALVAKVN